MVDRRSPQQAPTRELLSYFDALHVEHLGERAVINGGKDAKLLAGLCHSHGAERVKELMGLFFASEDEFLTRVGYTVGMFHSRMAGLISQQRKALQPSDVDAVLTVLKGTGTDGPLGTQRPPAGRSLETAETGYPREARRPAGRALHRGHGGLLD